MNSTSSTRKNVDFFPVFAAMAVFMISGIFYGTVSLTTNTTNTDSEVLGASTVEYTATLKVQDNTTLMTYTDIVFEEGNTAYDLLLNARSQTSFDFEAERYDFGYYVHTINGRRALNNEYWKFIINGEDATVQMEEYEVQTGDVLEFEIEKY
jgi:hypothetical protein